MKIISITKINDFLKCRQLYFYRYIEKLEKKEISIHFRIGSLVHKLIEIYYQDMDNFNIEIIKSEVEKASLKKEENMIISMLRNYIYFTKKEDKEYKKEIELYFEFPYNSIVLNGRMDAVFIKENEIVLVEHKTVSRLENYNYFIPYDIQINFYCFVYDYLYNLKPSRIFYNQIAKIESDKVDDNKLFSRYYFDVNWKIIEDFETQLNMIIKEIVKMENRGLYYKQPNKLGCKFCIYKKICLESDKQYIQNLKDKYFVKKQ